VGVRVELYCDTDVYFGKDRVGGTRIRSLSHINGPVNAPIIVGRGKRGTWPVKPLATTKTADPAPLSPVDKLRAEWQTADPERRKVIEAEVAALQQGEEA